MLYNTLPIAEGHFVYIFLRLARMPWDVFHPAWR